MSGPASLWQVLASAKRTGTLFNTYTTAKRVINDEDVVNWPGNSMPLGTRLKILVAGALSNVATTPGNVFFQVMMGPTANIIAWTSGNLALNASARTLLPFSLEIDLKMTAQGTSTSAAFTGFGKFGGIHLTNTDTVINVPTTAPAAGTGWDSVGPSGNVMDFFVGFSNSQAGNGVQIYNYDVLQLSGLGQ